MTETKNVTWMTKKEVAEYLRLAPRTIEKWMQGGRLKEGEHYRRIGYKTLLFDKESLSTIYN
jgi:excisionase family DNA binding protein